MTDLERARSELLDIVACAYQGMWTQPLIARVTEILAAARREGENQAWADISKIETEAFIRGRKAGLNLAALEDKYGSFDAKVQAQIADAERRGAEEMRERAAQRLLNGSFLHDEAPAARLAREAAATIRALPLTPEGPAAPCPYWGLADHSKCCGKEPK